MDALGKATKTLLNNYGVHVVNETKKGKSYLSVTPNQNTNKKMGSKKTTNHRSFFDPKHID